MNISSDYAYDNINISDFGMFPERNRYSMKHGKTGGRKKFKARVKKDLKRKKAAKKSRKLNR